MRYSDGVQDHVNKDVAPHTALATFVALFLISAGLLFTIQWRQEDTIRITQTERVNLCSQADNIVECITAVGS